MKHPVPIKIFMPSCSIRKTWWKLPGCFIRRSSGCRMTERMNYELYNTCFASLMHEVSYIDLGLMDYKETWDYQAGLQKRIIEAKTGSKTVTPKNYLLFVEHPH